MRPGIVRVMVPIFRDMPGYAVCKVECKCGRVELKKTRNGETFCKHCGTVIRPDPVSEAFRTVEELAEYLGGTSQPDQSDDLRDRISQLEKTLADKDQELSETYALIDGYRGKIHDLEQELKISGARSAELEDLKGENLRIRESLESRVETAESELDICRRDNKRMVSENKALEETNRHLHSEISRFGDMNIRDIMSVFMEYAAAVNNLILEEDDGENLKRVASARTMHMIMKLGGTGVYVTHHSPGEPLRNGRVDVTETATDDPGLDMKVVHSNRFGCTFRNDVYAPIVENVTVNRFVNNKEVKE